MDYINPKRCYNCSKTFKLVSDLTRHKNRITPCLIREVLPDQVDNPNKCIFCNKILSKKEHLTRHLKICKIKNGGMEILDDKIRYEQQIRILEEKDKQKDEKINEMHDRMLQMEEQMQQMAQQLIMPAQVNNTINNNIVVHFHNYTDPKLDTLKLEQEDLLANDLTMKFIEMIYFNKNIPENHVVFRPNIREQRLLVHENNNWKTVAGDDLDQTLINLRTTAYNAGTAKIEESNLCGDDLDNLCPVARTAVYEFNGGSHERIQNEEIMKLVTSLRQVVRATLNRSNVM